MTLKAQFFFEILFAAGFFFFHSHTTTNVVEDTPECNMFSWCIQSLMKISILHECKQIVPQGDHKPYHNL